MIRTVTLAQTEKKEGISKQGIPSFLLLKVLFSFTLVKMFIIYFLIAFATLDVRMYAYRIAKTISVPKFPRSNVRTVTLAQTEKEKGISNFGIPSFFTIKCCFRLPS